jgi:hypothetical protein
VFLHFPLCCSTSIHKMRRQVGEACRPVCVITLSRPENDAFPATKKQSTRIDREGRREVREHASRFQAKHLFPGAVHEKPLRKRERVKEGSRQAHKRYWILRPGPGRTKESFLAPSARLRGTWRVRCSGCLDFFLPILNSAQDHSRQIFFSFYNYTLHI